MKNYSVQDEPFAETVVLKKISFKIHKNVLTTSHSTTM